MININKIENILNSTNLQQIEDSIANKLGCGLYKDNISLLAGFLKEEIEASMLSLYDIEYFMTNHSKEVIDFGLKFLGKSKLQNLSTGIAITYSIYLIYLNDKDERELLEYLKKRRIPKPQKLLEQLCTIKKEMGYSK